MPSATSASKKSSALRSCRPTRPRSASASSGPAAESSLNSRSSTALSRVFEPQKAMPSCMISSGAGPVCICSEVAAVVGSCVAIVSPSARCALRPRRGAAQFQAIEDPDAGQPAICALRVRPLELVHLRVRVLVVERQGSVCGNAPIDAVADLGDFVLESLRQIDAHAMLVGADLRIDDGSDLAFAKSGDPERAAALVAVDVQIDLGDGGRPVVGAHRRKDFEVRSAVPAGREFLERLALLVAGALVGDELTRAVALVDRARPVDRESEPHPVERGLAEVALADLPDEECLAVVLVRVGVELAGACPIAAAGDGVIPLDAPARLAVGAHRALRSGSLGGLLGCYS